MKGCGLRRMICDDIMRWDLGWGIGGGKLGYGKQVCRTDLHMGVIIRPKVLAAKC